MANLSLQRRLAADVLKCGKGRVWLNPNEKVDQLNQASSRYGVRRLIKDGLIMKLPIKSHSRGRTRIYHRAKVLGRHRGMGKRHGTKEARMPSKDLWIMKVRCLRRVLRKAREQKKLDHHSYHRFYLKAKGNQYKSRRNLIEAIYTFRAESKREKALKTAAPQTAQK